ncbi:MAG: hypothetical protein H7210_10030 [Pyrinomonadaceae bacterium]|nr:hypothetical protein [Phycisphaerales bacterium]
MPALIFSPIAHISTPPATVLTIAVQKLSAPPIIEKMAFEQPWLSMACLVAAGAAAMWFFSRTSQSRRGLLALGICLVLAAANFLASMLVTTTREEVGALTRQVITHVTAGDATSLAPMLRSDLVVYPFGMSRDRVLDLVSTSMRGQYAVKDSSVRELIAAQDSTVAVRSQFHLRATPTQAGYGFPVSSWWMLTWQRDTATGGWLISRIECQQIDGVTNVENIRP